jgi:hypothetical protein
LLERVLVSLVHSLDWHWVALLELLLVGQLVEL